MVAFKSIAPPPPPPPPPEEEPPALAALTVGVTLSLVTLPELLVSVTVKVQDSADNSSFADVAVLATSVATGSGGTGSAAASLTQRVPLTLTCPQPRVWRWECEWVPVWIFELTA